MQVLRFGKSMDYNYRLLLENIQDHAIFLLSKEGHILYANQAIEQVTGYSKNEVMKEHLSKIFRPVTDNTSITEPLVAAEEKGFYLEEGWQQKKNGSKYWATIRITKVINDGKESDGFTCTLDDLTDRKINDQQITDREERYRLLVETVKDYGIFMLDTEGYIVSWNEGAKRIKGYEAYEIIGKHFSVFYKKEEQDAKKPQKELELAKLTGRYEEEGWRIRKNGSVFWANIVITAVYNKQDVLIGFSKVTRDLTERKAAEDALKSSEKQYRALVNSVPDYGILMLDEKGKILNSNQGATRMLGYTELELLGKPTSIFYSREDILNGVVARSISKASEKGEFQKEGLLVKKDGRNFWASITLSAMYNEEGILSGYSNVVRDITERKQTEIALRESEERSRLLVEGVKDYAILMLDPEGKVVSWNEGAKRIKGYSSFEAIGKHLSIFYTAEDKESRKPETQLILARENGRYQEEGWRVRKNGSLFWAHITITPVTNGLGELIGFSEIAADFTLKKETEDALRQSEERFRLLIGQVKDYGIFMLDETGRIISWNQGAQNIKGYKPEEIIGKHFSIFYTAADKEKRKPEMELRVASAEGTYQEEGWRLRKDGTMFWANILITAIFNQHKKLIGFSKVTRDLTERMKAETALRKSEERYRILSEELRRTNSDLQYANEELEQFTTIVSHDLQEPLRTINSFLQLLDLKLGKDMDDARSYITKAINGSNRMKELIINLLNYTQLSRDKIIIEDVNVNEVISDVLQNLRDSIESSEAEIVIDNKVTVVRGDKVQLVQLFQNLVSNGMKFTRDKKPRVIIRGREEDAHAIFSISDNGIGIAPENINKVFDLFKRLHSKKEFPGTGIGLSICKKIIERHHGKIWIESEKDKGTTFHFTIRPTDLTASDYGKN